MSFNDNLQHRITKSRNFKEISWILYALPLGILFLVLAVTNFSHGAAILLFAIGLILWLPGVIIHYQYYMDNKGISVKISKESKTIEVTTPTTTKTFEKGDIKEVLIVESGINKFAWGQYGFARIEFKTGEIINLTNLMLDQLFIADNFSLDDLKVLKAETLIPTLDKKTRL
jgi:hypothetical protein